jgi:hypothetical protein
LIC